MKGTFRRFVVDSEGVVTVQEYRLIHRPGWVFAVALIYP
ncbi:hypothetical protein PBI_FLOOF_79 [Microbacterium phage Floof]|uniref:Uncharacterized protein n=1 Tax=Microbacterium phage Floof TaxID=2201433 RepID=A0A2Z4Q4M9_9CAUD|nr:hypothetical protein PBI_FLOOF_79 [Microbacterium phage Floof]